MVGLPWGQFQGLFREAILVTSFRIWGWVRGSPTIIAVLQALVA